MNRGTQVGGGHEQPETAWAFKSLEKVQVEKLNPDSMMGPRYSQPKVVDGSSRFATLNPKPLNPKPYNVDLRYIGCKAAKLHLPQA